MAVGASLVAGGWLTLLIVLTFLGPQRTIAVIGPQARSLAAIAEANGRILMAYDHVTIARAEEAGFVARLYSAGAWLVLDAEQAGGCTGLPPKRAAAR